VKLCEKRSAAQKSFRSYSTQVIAVKRVAERARRDSNPQPSVPKAEPERTPKGHFTDVREMSATVPMQQNFFDNIPFP
jgi:hypothetical protein